MLVGCNGCMSPRVQKHVRFFAGSPNCHGCTVNDGPHPTMARAYLCITGFSTATYSALPRRHSRKNAAPSSMSAHRLRSASHRTPELHNLVQGGCAIMPAQGLRSCSLTSPWICGPGRSVGRRSHDTASIPCAKNASRTLPENSQAMSHVIASPPRPAPRPAQPTNGGTQASRQQSNGKGLGNHPSATLFRSWWWYWYAWS